MTVRPWDGHPPTRPSAGTPSVPPLSLSSSLSLSLPLSLSLNTLPVIDYPRAIDQKDPFREGNVLPHFGLPRHGGHVAHLLRA